MRAQTHPLGENSITRGLPSLRYWSLKPSIFLSNSGLPPLSTSLRMCRRIYRSPTAITASSGNFDAWMDAASTRSNDGDGELSEECSELTREAYIGLFVRRLGMDNMPEDREQAVRALWRHSLGGKKNVDHIVSFPGILPLIVSLVPSNRLAASEAAVGLLRNISLYDDQRNVVIHVGAVEEIIGILTRRSLSPQRENCRSVSKLLGVFGICPERSWQGAR